MVMEKTDLVLLVVELIFRITMCTIREKKYGVRDITLNDKGKKGLLVCQRQYFFGKNLLCFCNGFLKRNICVENIKNLIL
jgi:hypothetical protein